MDTIERKPAYGEVGETDMTEEYQGWTNRETWCVNLHLSNDRSMYETVRAMKASSLQADQLAKRIDNYVTGLFDTGSNAFGRDLISACLARVNWVEIAEHWMEA